MRRSLVLFSALLATNAGAEPGGTLSGAVRLGDGWIRGPRPESSRPLASADLGPLSVRLAPLSLGREQPDLHLLGGG